MKIKFKEVGYGIASRVGNIVYMNKNLHSYPEVREALIQHELGHSSGYNFKDITDDFGIKQLDGLKKKYYKFILKNPSSWTEYLPVYRCGGKWIYSPSIFLIWVFAIVIGLIVIRNI